MAIGLGILYPHNLFLEVFTEQGVIIGLSFTFIVLAILLRCLKASRTSPIALGVTALLVTEIIHVSVSGDLKAPIFFFLLALAFLVGRGKAKANESDKTSQSPSLYESTIFRKNSAPGRQ